MGNSELWEIGFYGIWKLGGPGERLKIEILLVDIRDIQ